MQKICPKCASLQNYSTANGEDYCDTCGMTESSALRFNKNVKQAESRRRLRLLLASIVAAIVVGAGLFAFAYQPDRMTDALTRSVIKAVVMVAVFGGVAWLLKKLFK